MQHSKSHGYHPLKITERPPFEKGENRLTLVDLFAGCGGLTLGVAQAAIEMGRRIEIPLAVEIDPNAAAVYRSNFPSVSRMEVSDILDILSPNIESPLLLSEINLKKTVGKIDVLVGGPPCQGHSSLNNHTRGNDPKNALYLLMARAALVFSPEVVLIENVPAVIKDKYQGNNVVEATKKALITQGYQVYEEVVSLHKLGVAQTRKRHVLFAWNGEGDNPLELITKDQPKTKTEGPNLKWAIGDLSEPACKNIFNTPSRVSDKNLVRMQYLLDTDTYDLPNYMRPECHQGNHTYKSMYGRLRWGKPAQTLTRGFGSIGQGRYMHPDLPRALTPHEAARIQGFPDYFSFEKVKNRTALSVMIGNAVPPQLSNEIISAYWKGMKEA